MIGTGTRRDGKKTKKNTVVPERKIILPVSVKLSHLKYVKKYLNLAH